MSVAPYAVTPRFFFLILLCFGIWQEIAEERMKKLEERKKAAAEEAGALEDGV